MHLHCNKVVKNADLDDFTDNNPIIHHLSPLLRLIVLEMIVAEKLKINVIIRIHIFRHIESLLRNCIKNNPKKEALRLYTFILSRIHYYNMQLVYPYSKDFKSNV